MSRDIARVELLIKLMEYIQVRSMDNEEYYLRDIGLCTCDRIISNFRWK